MANRKKPTLAPTMQDVARAAGVSKMTVSRALKKDGPISAKTRAHILKIVRQMNYVPDRMAGSLSTKRSGFVALLVPSLNNFHFAQTVQALTEELEGIGQQILLGHTDYSAEREEALVEAMLQRRPEAIILSYDGHSDQTVELLHKAHIPVVELWERPDHPIQHTVGFSNSDAAFAMTEALIKRGYRNIAFLGEAEDAWTRGAARRQGFIAGMETAGLSAHRLLRYGKPPLSIEDGTIAGPQLLELFPDTDCLFCVSDAPAFGALTALSQTGIQIPKDLGIVGFGNFEISRFATPAITTVIVDPHRIGKAAGQLVGELLSNIPKTTDDTKHLAIEINLSFRGTTRSDP